MTETPKCPYCGAEMELHHIPDGLWCKSYNDKIEKAESEIRRLQKECIDFAELLDAIEAIDNEHPYRIAGHYDTYSDYNQGWADACALIEEMLESKMKSSRSEGTDPE